MSGPWIRLAHILLLSAVPFLGVLYAVLIPPFQVPDEPRHLYRAYDVTYGRCIPAEVTVVPASYLDLQTRFSSPLENAPPALRWVSFHDFSTWLKQPLAPQVLATIRNPIANVYSCVPYLPAALALAAAGRAGLSPLASVWSGRLTNLLCATGLIFLAFRCLPEYRLHVAAIALTPMTLQQIASLSADCITIGIYLLLAAYVIRLAFAETSEQLSYRQYVWLVLLVGLAALSKPYPVTGLVPALIPARRVGGLRRYVLFVAAFVLLAVLLTAGWQLATTEQYGLLAQERLKAGVDMAGNARYLGRHPVAFIGIAARTFGNHYLEYCEGFIGILASVTLHQPNWALFLYAAVLIWIAVTQAGRFVPSLLQRVIILLALLGAALSTAAALWIIMVPASQVSSVVSSLEISGFQGRYFIPLGVPAMMLAATRKLGRLRFQYAAFVLLFVAAVVNASALRSVWLTFWRTVQ